MNFNDFHFIRPLCLLALIPYLIIVVAMLRQRWGQASWSTVCDAELLPYLLQNKRIRNSRLPFIMGTLAALLAIIAMAGPSWQRLPAPVFRNDSALVIALNLSRSMDAEDIKPSRLIRARYKIADMLRLRKDGQTALLVYAGDAFTVTPLTNDTETIASQLEALTPDIMPGSGRNTAAVLRRATDLFKQAGLHKGHIVLITDGVELDDALPAVHSLEGFSLSVLGVGTPEGAPIALPAGGFLKDNQGSIVIPKLNVDDLTQLASAGNGVYHSLTANDADIRTLLASVDSPDQQRRAVSENPLVFELWEDKGPWVLLLALPLAALSFRKGLLGLVFLLILPFPEQGYAMEWQDLWLTQDQQAAKAFERKRYDEASKLFKNPDWKLAAQYKAGKPVTGDMLEPASATGFYNLGNVLAKSGRFEEAITAYEQSLKLDPDNEDARYNKGIVEKELEKQKKEQEQTQKENQQPGDNPKQPPNKNDGQNQDDEKERNQDAESGDEDSSNHPETKSERASEHEESVTEQPLQNKPDEKSAAEQAGTESPRQEEQNKFPEQPNQKSVSEGDSSDEQQQANEQWLNRIPDDPAGLLRRKFKYQYGQRQEQQ